MILNLLRSKRKLWVICKYLLVLSVLFIGAVKLRDKHSHQQAQAAVKIQREPVISNAGLEKFKEIQNQIIQEYVDPPKKEAEPKEEFAQDIPVQPPKPIGKPLNKFDVQIAADLKKLRPGLGDDGKAVKLTGKELEEAEEIMKKEAFNLIISDQISYNRSLPDVRDSQCKSLTYDKILPSASVVIIFTNEAWSPLIRTIWSVLNRSPPQYLKEIVLIDDFSDREELQGKLDRYIETSLPSKVRLVRLKERQGLIRARLAGAKEAKGDVLIFLDSHCEVTKIKFICSYAN